MKDLFKNDIDRPINGVIKVGQRTDADISEELREYVITSELRGYFHKFYDCYVDALQAPTDKIGVWISGFFGSGKSHFLKILSYLLENREIEDRGEVRKALDYFEDKVEDATLYAAMQRAGQVSKDVILFNIDSKADSNSKSSKEGIVEVFLKVFNDHRGYFGAAPQIADLERRLETEGRYADFKAAYEQLADEPWEEGRESWDFFGETIITALQQGAGFSEADARRVFDNATEGDTYRISVERFAKIIKSYLDTQPKDHQVVFMVDEVGQYIGENTDLMLNMQTVAEDLGVICEGRAWVMVTSQEDIDSITEHRVKGNDFSKIQGRFQTRLSLSSANTDEVIKLRLLEKTDSAEASLKARYARDEQTLTNAIRFDSSTADMPRFESADAFAKSYPFVPYQFKLLQNVFTQIRLHGSSGKHLSQGERSMLDAFQIAAIALNDSEIGALAPFYSFYPAIEGFLDTTVRSEIDNARKNPSLQQPFDPKLLSVLFMIKYVKEISGSVDNLVTLCLDRIDADRLELTKQVKEALARLERQTLVQRNGDVYEFLTNEEQDISREIKNFSLNPGELHSELQKMMWDELYTNKKYRFQKRYDYSFNRLLDGKSYSTSTSDLTLHVVTPVGNVYDDYRDEASVSLRSRDDEAIVRLPDRRDVFNELELYVRTDRYFKQKHSENTSPSVQTILVARSRENDQRRKRVVNALSDLVTEADVFVQGAKLNTTGSSPTATLDSALDTLVENVYKKLGYVERPYENKQDIEAVLEVGRSSVQADADGHTPNERARDEMLHWLNEQQNRRTTVTLKSLEEHFSARPYGWRRDDIHGILAELLVQGKADLRRAQQSVDLGRSGLVDEMSLRSKQDSFTVRVPQSVNSAHLQTARELAKEYLANDAATFNAPPSDAQVLYKTYRDVLADRKQTIERYLDDAKRKNYPFQDKLAAHQDLLGTLLRPNDAADFFAVLSEHEQAFEDFAEESEKIQSFFNPRSSGQRDAFDKARALLHDRQSDLTHLNDPDLQANIDQAKAVLGSADPTADIPQLPRLLEPVTKRLDELLDTHKQQARAVWQQAVQDETAFADDQGVSAEARDRLLRPLVELKSSLDAAPTIDAAIARKVSVGNRQQQVHDAIIEHINQQAAASAETTEAVAPPKTITTLHPAKHAHKRVLESEADVRDYLQRLERALLDEIAAGRRISIE